MSDFEVTFAIIGLLAIDALMMSSPPHLQHKSSWLAYFGAVCIINIAVVVAIFISRMMIA